jgi:hypothetical protein
MAQIGYIESLLGNIDDLPTKLAIRRVAEELLGRIADLESVVGTGGSGPVSPPVPSPPLAHHATHEPGGADALVGAAWLAQQNKFTHSQGSSPPAIEIDTLYPGVAFRENSQLVNERIFRIIGLNKTLLFQALNDVYQGAVTSITLNRDGTVVVGGGMTTNSWIISTGPIYPGRADNGAAQATWALYSHGSYGLWSNTGLYLTQALVVAAGVKFPAAQNALGDANTLDDYEEGTWTPVIQSAGGGTGTYARNYGTYTKIGNLVLCHYDIQLAAPSGFVDGYAYIAGMPFSATGLYGHGITGGHNFAIAVVFVTANVEPGNARAHVVVKQTTTGNAPFAMSLNQFGPTIGTIVGSCIFRTTT